MIGQVLRDKGAVSANLRMLERKFHQVCYLPFLNLLLMCFLWKLSQIEHLLYRKSNFQKGLEWLTKSDYQFQIIILWWSFRDHHLENCCPQLITISKWNFKLILELNRKPPIHLANTNLSLKPVGFNWHGAFLLELSTSNHLNNFYLN